MALAITAVLVIAVAVTGLLFWPVTGDRDAGRGAAPPAVQRRGAHTLAGHTVLLDPGHNGGNSADAGAIGRQVDAGGFQKPCDTVGAQSADGYAEHAFVFDVATRAADALRALGAKVLLTRADDTGVGPCVDERARIGNAAAADAVVSIHADGGPPEGSGFHVIAPALSPDGGNGDILAGSGRLADLVRESFGATTGQAPADYLGDDGISVRSDLGGLNLSRVPKVFLECGNMRNPGDAGRMRDPGWRARAAAGIVDGLVAFLTGDRRTGGAEPAAAQRGA